ncbi:PLxRFG domain-containing protein [Rhodoblastus acidophilus]|uniref:PLxRFG domain-containing protein n=1 Tax=Rhodoblastus acidophilus TaxID=1074 RepID=A0A6N8DLM0_RHOAC|nr:PLxRFG domain-containing protein [Rhodoblastus acidophilus]MCW2275152.1 N12 class adenine-specific DNA methylase [Rhodoblastus acidophilus]MTV31420.1 PLxRFG domain-containing protein [Rhodoblastus acidophilus]
MADIAAASPIDQLLADSTTKLNTATGGGGGGMSGPSALDQGMVRSFEQAADQFNVPVDALLAMAERDSGFDAYRRSSGPGPKTRGIIAMNDADMQRTGVNPYVPQQVVTAAAQKLRGYLNSGMSLDDAIRAHASGSNNPADWGPQATEYLSDVQKRAARFADALYPATPEPTEPAPDPSAAADGPTFGGDIARSAGRGFATLLNVPFEIASALGSQWAEGVAAPVRAANEESKKQDTKATQEARAAFDKLGNRITKIQEDTKATGLKGWLSTVAANPMDAMKDLGESAFAAASDPRLLATMVGESAPSMIGVGMAGRAGNTLAKGLGAGARMTQAATTGGVVAGSSAMSAGSIAEAVNEDVAKLSPEKLKELAPHAKDEDEARATVRQNAYMTVNTLIASIAAGSLDGFGQGAEKLIANGFRTSAGAIRQAATTMKHEAAQEFVQTGAEDIGQGLAKDQINPDKNNYDGMLRDMGSAATVGAAMGAGTGAIAGARGIRQSEPPAPQDEPLALPPPSDFNVGPDGQAREGSARVRQLPPPPDFRVDGEGNASAPGDNNPVPPPQPNQPPGWKAGTEQWAEPAGNDVGAPTAPANHGPLSRALHAGAPHIAEASKPAGNPVIVTDELGTRAGHIVSQDANGVTFVDADGSIELFSPADLAGGKIKITTGDHGATAPKSFEAAQAEKAAAAMPSFDHQAPAETDHGVLPQPGSAEDQTHIAAAVKAEEKPVEAAKPEATPAAKVEPTKPTEPAEPAPQAQEGGIAEQAAASVAQHVKPHDKSLAEMSEAELRDRLKYVAEQAKGSGWNKPLVKARKEVEAEIDQRVSAAKKANAEAAPVEAAPVEKPAEKPAEAPKAEPKPKAEPGAPATDAHAGKWFGSPEKAQAYVEKKGIAATHEPKKTGAKRWEIKPKSEGRIEEAPPAPATPAPSAVKPEAAPAPKMAEKPKAAEPPKQEPAPAPQPAPAPKAEQPKAETPKAPEPAPSPAPAAASEQAKPAETAPEAKPGYGDKNKLVGNDRAAELREKLRQKLKAAGHTLNSGIDPEMLAIGAELAVYHIEAGARAFGDFAKVMARDLGAKLGDLKPYLRSWYNGARDMMEDHGHDVADLDAPDKVKSELARVLSEEATNGSDEQGRNPSDRKGVSDAESGPEDAAQHGTGRPDQEGVAGGKPGDVGEAPKGADDGQAGVRDAAENVGGNGQASGSGGSGNGRTRAGRKRKSDDGTGEPKSGPVTPEEAKDVPPALPKAENFHIDNPLEIVGGGPVARFDRNMAAIKLFNVLREEGRPATAEEMRTLAGYTGWGSFGQELFQGTWERPMHKPAWEERGAWLRDHLGQEEWESAQRSITNAHYTDPPTVLAMWDMMRRMGFKSGRVLEPSMGIGNFFGLMPKDMKDRSKLSGIEMDQLTGGMAKLLYPDANVQIMPYQESRTPDNFHDAVVGNWPFENTVIADRRYNKLEPFLHDYFFLKTLDQVRPGGIVMGITSSGTMDKQAVRIRANLAKKAELVAAIRLPSGAFEEYAGTKVVTDIVILKKRPQELSLVPEDANWLKTVQVDTPSGQKVSINEYYVKNPQNVIGTTDFGHGTTRGRPGMIVHRPENMAERLKEAVKLIPENVYQKDDTAKKISYITNHTADREGSLTTQGGKLYVVRGEQLAPAGELVKYEVKDTAETARREGELNSLIDMRRKYGQLIDAERNGTDAEPARAALRAAYEAFAKANGKLGESFGLNYLKKISDPFYPAIASLEIGGKPAAILSRSTMRAAPKMENPSIQDAYVLARNGGSISPRLDEIAALAKKPVDKVKAELVKSGAVFETPTGDVVPSDIYLSGNVREKLRQAEAAAKDNAAMQHNVEALKAVQPKDTPYFNIETQLGATWVPPSVYRDYIGHMLNLDDASKHVGVSFRNGRWKAELRPGTNSRTEAATGYGTPHLPFSRLVNLAMTNQLAKIYGKDADGKDVFDQKATDEANERIGKIREDFGDWLWSDPERTVAMEREYNEATNSIATPNYDGSFLTFPGMALQFGNSPFDLRQHQADAIWRALVNRRSINAHEVGTGKTFTMGGIAVESRRYGIAKKPMILAHNANSKSVAAEIQQMYPSAKVLYIDNLSPDTIDVKMRQIANDDWDAIVVPHSVLDRLALREETLMKMAEEQIQALEDEALEAAKDDGTDLDVGMMDDPEAMKKVRSVTAKELVKARNRIIENIKKQAQKSSREGAMAFEDTGIDMVMVDEAHEFKKPPIATRMRIKGLNTGTSDRSIALKFLTDYIRANNGGGNVHTFTGTPITNTLTEVFHQMRYVMEDEMRRAGINDWDGWFGSFARELYDVELNSAGEYEGVSRLAAFVNVPELRRLIGQYMDTVFADDMPEMQPRETSSGKTMAAKNLTELERAELLNGRTEGAKNRPYKKVVNVTSDMTEPQLAAFREIQQLAQRWRNMAPLERKRTMQEGGPESPILTEGMANKASFDVRQLEGERLAGMEGKVPDHEGSKLSNVVKNVKEVFDSHPLANQVIFASQGFSNTVSRSGGRDAAGEKIKRTVKVFASIKDLVARLEQAGIPKEQIAVVDGSTSKDKRKLIADAMNSGEIRVVIGNTQTLGVGVNMQRNLRAMHHLDAPYMPGDLEQRNGRGHRQGNQWNTVLEYRYMTDRLDGRRWQILARKETFIKAFLKASADQRTIEGDAASEDESDILSSFAEAAGDPRILIKEKLKKTIERLQRAERIHRTGIADARGRHRQSQEAIASRTSEIESIEKNGTVAKAKKLVADNAGDGFKAEIDGKTYDKRKDFDAAYDQFVARNMHAGDEPRVIGKFGGHDIKAGWWKYAAKPEMFVEIDGHKFATNGGIAGVEGSARRFPDRVEGLRQDAEKLKNTVGRLEDVMKTPFGRAKDLADAAERLSSLDRDIVENPVPPPAWLRVGTPTETPVFWHGKEFEVSGHLYSNEGWFVRATDGKGEVTIPYNEATDKNGMPLYEPREFKKPEVIDGQKSTAPAAEGGEDAPKLSVAQDAAAEGMSAATLRSYLTTGAQGDTIARLIDAGHVVLHDDATTVPAKPKSDGILQGATMGDGKVHLVAGNMSPERARGILLHEIFHAGGERLVGSTKWDNLMQRTWAAAEAAMGRISEGKARPQDAFWQDALNSAEMAGAPYEHFAEEIAAYAIEHSDAAPAGLREVADRLMGAVKDWLFRRFGKQFGAVTPAQLRSLAKAALHSHEGRAERLEAGEDGVRFSMGNHGARVGDKAKGLYSKATRAASDFLTSAMAGAKEAADNVGSMSVLSLVPVRPLFLELARHTPSARHYIDTKQAMDSLRHALNEGDAKVLERWSKWVRATKLTKNGLKPLNREANERLMDLMHESTIAQVDPSGKFDQRLSRDDVNVLRDASKRGTPAYEEALERKAKDDARATAYRALKDRFDALPDEAKELYKDVRDAYKNRADETENEIVGNMRKAIDQISKNADEKHTAEMKRIKDEGLTGTAKADAIKAADNALLMAKTRVTRNKAARLKQLRAEFETNRIEPYFPLARFGSYFVTARDAAGKVKSFSRFEKRGEQRRFAEAMRANGFDVQEGLASLKGDLERSIDPRFVSEVDDILAAANAPEAVRDAIWQKYLESLPDLSMRKHSIHRKNREGWNPDALRAFAHNMFHSAHQLSRLRYGQDLQGHIDEARKEVESAPDPVRAQAVVNEMVRAHDFAMNPKGAAWSYRATSLAFLWTMGWNLSTGLVVLHDPIQRGIPNLGYDAETGNVGIKRAAAEMAKTFSEVMRGKGFIENSATLTGDERDAMRRAKELNVIESTNAHDLAGVSDAGIDYSPWMHKTMQTASLPLHHAERVNREVIFLAAYRIARDAGMNHGAAVKKAADLTWMSQFDTQASSKARVMRGPVGRAALALRNFHFNILYRFFKDAHEAMTGMEPAAKKAAMGRVVSSVAITAAMAGIRGAYFYKLILPVAAMALSAAGMYDDKDQEPSEALRRTVLKATGDTMIGRAVGGMMMDGIPGYWTGTNLSERIGVADIGFRPPDRDMNPEQGWNYWLQQAGGPALEIAHGIYTGAADMSKGEFLRGLKEMLPASARNLVKAGQYAHEGVKTRRGDSVVEHVAPQDIVKQAIGFGPAEISDRFQRNTFQNNIQKRLAEERKEILTKAAKARMEGNQEAFEAALEEVRKYNAANPRDAIKGKGILQSIKSRRNLSDKAEYGVVLKPGTADRVKGVTSPSIYSREE